MKLCLQISFFTTNLYQYIFHASYTTLKFQYSVRLHHEFIFPLKQKSD